MEHIFDLSGKVALVTGGGTGIGFGIANQFVKLGAKVVITGRSREILQTAKNSLGRNCFFYVNDVTQKEKHVALIEDIETTDREFEAVMDTNLTSVFALTREVLKYMIPRKKGSIISISSMSALYGLPQVAAYSSSKTALLGLTRSLATDYSHTGVRFNAIAPGFIETKMVREVMNRDPEREKRILARTPSQRFGAPSDIGKAAAFLASDASDYITGVCLPVDGGNSIGF
jgi:gluconate 5-dehydrogenase